MGREGEEFRAHRKEEKLMFFGMTFVEYDMVTLDEGGRAKMQDEVLCRKEQSLLAVPKTLVFVEYDMLTPDEGELARMEVADPATEDVVLPFKVQVIQ